MSSTTYARHWLKQAIFTNEFNFSSLKSQTHHHFGNVNKLVTFCHRFSALGTMVRNAGQLPQPFWLGAACGGGSRSAARCAART
jgi:hypothetical protein|nr:MAG TPA: hypothetical protein [Caudoviricetes sp.]